jgi:flagellar hook-associated protein 2
MPIRITGMNSGLDTDSIITALTQRHQDKVDKFTGYQKKLTWKQEKWKDLNKKVTKFYNGTLSNLRFSTAYNKKTTTASNSSAVSVVTGDGAMVAEQTLDITSVAKSAFLTGNKVTYTGENSEEVSAKKSTTMSELGLSSGTLSFKIGNSDTDLISVDVDADDSIEKVLNKLRSKASSDTGTKLNFNYDENNGRFFVAAQKTGENYNFEAVSGSIADKLGFTNANYSEGKSAAITLNGVDYTSDTNTFEINGLTITANEVASGITLSTKQDTSGIYDNIKKLLKEYNELMKEFATLYNADAAKKYSMLTDDQKDEMTDKEIEDWENKIKDGLLSGDETIGNIRTGIKGIVGSTFNVTLKDGTTSAISLSYFGIGTGSYFSTEEDERDALHIDGDSDDSLTSGNADKLSALISTDPDAVQSFFTQFAQGLYGKISDLMKGTTYSSSFTIYEDKLMASQYSAYNTKISDAQKALEAAQDRYYSKYTAMEKALSKINSSSSSLSGFFGS